MQTLTQPTLLLKPFAESGDKNTIPSTNTDASNPQLADLTNGFPAITSEDPDDGGLPPERKDFNGLGYLTTTYDYFYQAGGTFTFSPTISTAIGGYPLNARLWYTDSNGVSCILRSTIQNNTNNFLTDASVIGTSGSGKPWEIETFRGIQLNTQYVTNCITEIPQDIKLELSSGTFTLKSGSKVYIPNGSGTFDTITIASDKTATNTLNGTWVYYIDGSGNLGRQRISNCYSGGTDAASGTTYHTWYDTTNNIIKSYYESSSTYTQTSFPIAIVTVSGGAISSIDQVFNGFGYIGSTIFALPGVKGLAPNGRNADGTLENTSFTLSTVLTETRSDYGTNVRLIKIDATHFSAFASSNYRYDYEYNFNYESTTKRIMACVGTLITTSNKIDSFIMPEPFRAVDYSDIVNNSDTKNNSQSIATTSWCQTMFANAIGTPRDVTVLWGDGTGVNAPIEFQLSEDFTNFEQIGFVLTNDGGAGKATSIQSTYWLDDNLAHSENGSVLLGITHSGTASAGCEIRSYTASSNPSTKTLFKVQNENCLSFYIYGINRKVKNVQDPLL